MSLFSIIVMGVPSTSDYKKDEGEWSTTETVLIGGGVVVTSIVFIASIIGLGYCLIWL